MIHSVLLALDSTPASQSALDAAINFCQRVSEVTPDAKPIHLTGVAVVDKVGINLPMAAPIGGSAFKKDRDETLTAEAIEKAEAVLSQFELKCQAANLPHQAIRSEGLPDQQIELQAKRHNMIMIGQETTFDYARSNSVSDTLRKLLHDNPRPVIVCTEQIPEIRNVVILYDGSIPSSHSLHMWTLLKLRVPETKVHLVSVADDLEKANALIDEASALLKFHDVQPICYPIKRTGSVLQCLQEKIAEIQPRLVVMGAYGKGGLKEAFFGSTTNTLLEESICPLFLYK